MPSSWSQGHQELRQSQQCVGRRIVSPWLRFCFVSEDCEKTLKACMEVHDIPESKHVSDVQMGCRHNVRERANAGPFSTKKPESRDSVAVRECAELWEAAEKDLGRAPVCKPVPVVLAAALSIAADVVSDHEKFLGELEHDQSLSRDLRERVWKHVEHCGAPQGMSRCTSSCLTVEQQEKRPASDKRNLQQKSSSRPRTFSWHSQMTGP